MNGRRLAAPEAAFVPLFSCPAELGRRALVKRYARIGHELPNCRAPRHPQGAAIKLKNVAFHVVDGFSWKAR